MATQPWQDEIIELQTRLQFQDYALQQLDAELLAQKQAIDVLLRRLAELQEQVEDLRDGQYQGGSKPVDEKPPHY